MDFFFDPNLCSAVVYYLISYLYVRPHHGLRERALLGALALLLGTLAACKSDHVQNMYPHRPGAPVEVPAYDIGRLAGGRGCPDQVRA
jgi:hypothetical protein